MWIYSTISDFIKCGAYCAFNHIYIHDDFNANACISDIGDIETARSRCEIRRSEAFNADAPILRHYISTTPPSCVAHRNKFSYDDYAQNVRKPSDKLSSYCPCWQTQSDISIYSQSRNLSLNDNGIIQRKCAVFSQFSNNLEK